MPLATVVIILTMRAGWAEWMGINVRNDRNDRNDRNVSATLAQLVERRIRNA